MLWKPERREIGALVDEFEDIEVRRSGSGRFGRPDDAARQEQIEHRLLELLSVDVSDRQRRRHLRIPCDFWVEVHSTRGVASGAIVDVGAGGVFVETDLPTTVGDSIALEMERQPGSLQHGFVAQGVVAWIGGGPAWRKGFGLTFSVSDEDCRRKARRFVFELLRKRISIFD